MLFFTANIFFQTFPQKTNRKIYIYTYIWICSKFDYIQHSNFSELFIYFRKKSRILYLSIILFLNHLSLPKNFWKILFSFRLTNKIVAIISYVQNQFLKTLNIFDAMQKYYISKIYRMVNRQLVSEFRITANSDAICFPSILPISFFCEGRQGVFFSA